MNKTLKRLVGDNAEHLVAQRLIREGFSIIERNYQRPYGEIDIIAQKGDTIAFVEVKKRKSLALDPGELVGYSKQRKLIMVAKEYMATHDTAEKYCRFDVALVYDQAHGQECLYIANAFTQGEVW